jgi:hypothetical protein
MAETIDGLAMVKMVKREGCLFMRDDACTENEKANSQMAPEVDVNVNESNAEFSLKTLNGCRRFHVSHLPYGTTMIHDP